MGKQRRRLSAAIIVVLLLQVASVLFQVPAAKANDMVDLKLDARTAILIDAATGQVLFEMGADEALPPASMSKMMTEYIVMDHIKTGKLKWESIITVSKYAASIVGSSALLAEGEQYTVRQLFAAMSIYSANDASVAFAEAISGTEENFSKLMNQTAQKLGLSSKARFINATGLSRADMEGNDPKSLPGETLLTARDSAMLAYHIIKEHPDVLDFTKQPSYQLRTRDKDPMINWNWMVEANKDNLYLRQYAYEGLDGLKTGHTDEAKWCLTATAVRGGMRFISVIMGAPTEPKRFQESKKLLDYGFNNFEKRTLVQSKLELSQQKTVPVKKGKQLEVPIVTESALELILKKGDKTEPTYQIQIVDETVRTAPIKAGTVLGKATVLHNGKAVGQVNLVAASEVEKAGWFSLLLRSIGGFFNNLF
ncbi:D-alanyl-D-alanine carboxypeptidase family protein [Cohnella sp.]|uniref:D-alanyl-D-alanine carboxypeptidase family protein n=1 Tax=Cohnella sp. TaxID=1883426 RepID=UPI003565FB6F